MFNLLTTINQFPPDVVVVTTKQKPNKTTVGQTSSASKQPVKANAGSNKGKEKEVKSGKEVGQGRRNRKETNKGKEKEAGKGQEAGKGKGKEGGKGKTSQANEPASRRQGRKQTQKSAGDDDEHDSEDQQDRHLEDDETESDDSDGTEPSKFRSSQFSSN